MDESLDPAEVDEIVQALLLALEDRGIRALFMSLDGNTLTVRCQDREDVVPLCKRVVKEHEAPSDRTLN